MKRCHEPVSCDCCFLSGEIQWRVSSCLVAGIVAQWNCVLPILLEICQSGKMIALAGTVVKQQAMGCELDRQGQRSRVFIRMSGDSFGFAIF